MVFLLPTIFLCFLFFFFCFFARGTEGEGGFNFVFLLFCGEIFICSAFFSDCGDSNFRFFEGVAGFWCSDGAEKVSFGDLGGASIFCFLEGFELGGFEGCEGVPLGGFAGWFCFCGKFEFWYFGGLEVFSFGDLGGSLCESIFLFLEGFEVGGFGGVEGRPLGGWFCFCEKFGGRCEGEGTTSGRVMLCCCKFLEVELGFAGSTLGGCWGFWGTGD